jgi:hypothetical protein
VVCSTALPLKTNAVSLTFVDARWKETSNRFVEEAPLSLEKIREIADIQ